MANPGARGERDQSPGGALVAAHFLLLDVLDEIVASVDAPQAPGRGRLGLCRMLSQLVTAPVTGHVRYDVGTRTALLTVWRAAPAVPDPVRVVAERDGGRRDWWTTSRARHMLLDVMDQRFLAELPLAAHPPLLTMLVVGRPRPFTDTDSERMSSAHRSLVVLERVVENLLAEHGPGEQEGTAAGPAGLLTRREREVLAMLGQGLMARSMAQRLEVSERTVHKHLGNLYRKLDAHDRLLAVRRAEVLGLLPAAGSTASAPRPAEPARW
jgi:DNA-binding CsgD family transcriptional regulator